MNHRKRKTRQAQLFDALPRVRITMELRQAVLPTLAELIAAVLRQPDDSLREGGSRDGA